MLSLFEKIHDLIVAGDWRASTHALQRLEEHGILPSELADRISGGSPIEDYPDYHLGPCILILQEDRLGPLHCLWGLQLGTDRPAVLVTAYRPDPARWESDNRTRRS